MRFADEQVARMRRGLDEMRGAVPTLWRVLHYYYRFHTPTKRPEQRKEDYRQGTFWLRTLGPNYDLRKMGRREWESAERNRKSGATNATGEVVNDPAKRKEVGWRSVERTLGFLRSLCLWAVGFRDDDGNFLLEFDPSRGLKLPREPNPNRPVATHDRVDAIRKVYRQVMMRVQRGLNRVWVESYLVELFEIAVGSGRRISAVCSLRVEDLHLESTATCPHGSVTWAADRDKMGREWNCPISADVREALESALRKRTRLGVIGSGWLFPAPGNPSRALRYEEASVWLRRAEALAQLEPQKGTLWHAYRRLWASARKDLPDVDVAQAGGWSSLEALKSAYQQPDDATLLRVITHRAELREIK
jgi:integrase